jgi:hypothetical protein
VQSPSEAQDAAHALPPHTYGLQSVTVAAAQDPEPSQCCALVCVLPEHDCDDPQAVLIGRLAWTHAPVAQLNVAQAVFAGQTAAPQQALSTQYPLRHALPAPQPSPSDFFATHAWPAQ